MELYAFFIWPALVFAGLAAYGWYAYSRTGKHHPRLASWLGGSAVRDNGRLHQP